MIISLRAIDYALALRQHIVYWHSDNYCYWPSSKPMWWEHRVS